ncbi:MAG: peptidoglycan binding domain-containing protein, partial [Anaerolineales bacterium]|nr:peptidoglycan binding domain-containing protein [Anaerolineales bacterium]
MQIELAQTERNSIGYKLRWFSLGPITGLVLIAIAAMVTFSSYQTEHEDAVFTGVSVSGIELGGLSLTEAEQRLTAAAASPEQTAITFVDSQSGQEWHYSAADLGVQLDAAATVANAYQIGREGSLQERVSQQFDSWYYGHATSPVMVFDEAKLFSVIDQLASEIGQLPLDAAVDIAGDEITFSASQVGRALDKTDTYNRLVAPLSNLQSARVELLVHQSKPRVYDASAAAGQLRNILSGPMEFYLQTPIDGIDLSRITVSADNLREWLRISLIENEDGASSYNIFIDEVALRGWLTQYAQQIAREPERARFYFDDPTQELVLVEPHVNGRQLDIEATIAQFNEQVTTPNRSVPFVIEEIVPAVNSNATAEQLGITELVAESTTWFFGSSDGRKHNIARSASNFYGIVIAPGEEFSFNKYLGDISEEDGYKPA